MSYEVTNTLRSTSIIRVVGTAPANIALSEFATSENEVVTSASIKRVVWSTGGNVTVQRGATNVLSLYGSGDMRLAESGHVIANNSTQNIVVTITTGGTAIIEVSKVATYTQPLDGM
jgi:hypothetical protein